jgi:type II secretory pathway pseudopilin PulG
MLLVVALMAVFALTVITEMKFTMQRDQEQEMIHRGVQYSRAIRSYYKKFGRYPTRLEDLESANNLRFLRKRYKDPINKNQDFRLLHFGEQGVTLGGGGLSFGGGSIPGANPVGSPGINGSGPNGSAFGSSSFGNSTFGNSGNSGVNSSGVFARSSGFGGNSNSAFGTNSNASATNSNAPGTNSANGADSSSSPNSQDASSGKNSPAGASDQSSGQQPVGGGPIVGVASISKKTTIREFNKKKKYNEWQFVYDPTNEPRNGLITTPNQPLLQGFGSQPVQSAGPASTSSSPFGQSNGYGNNPNSSTPSAPAQTPSNPAPPQ